MDIKRTMESFGYTVPYVASRGEEAVEKAKEIMPDLILMDIILKGKMNGIEVANKLKKLDIPVIYLTAHSEETTANRALATEPYGYLLKPFDITELKFAIELAIYKNKTEKKLKASESNYNSLFENMLDAFAYHQIIIDGNNHPVDYIFLKVNGAFERFTGLKKDNIIGRRVTEVIPEITTTDRELIDLYGRVALTGESKIFELYFEPFDKFYSITAYSNEKGYFATIFEDITKRKLAEKALKKSESYYRTIFEHTGAATVILEEDRTISLANAEFEKLSGYSREELEGKKSWTDFVLKDDLLKMKEYHSLRRIDPETVPSIYDFRFIDREGSVKNIHLDVDMIPKTKKSVASLLDITVIKQAERALQESERNFRAVVENSNDGILIAAGDGHHVFANQKAAEITGYALPELLNMTLTDLAHPDEHEKLIKRYRERIEGKIVPPTYETLILRKDKKPVPIEISASKTIWKDQTADMVIIRDITKRKKAEKRINKLYRLYATLSQVNQSVVIAEGKDALFASICKICVDYGKFMMAWIGLVDHETGAIRPVAHYGHEDGYLEKISMNIHEEPSLDKPTTMGTDTGELIIIDDIEKQLNLKWREEALKRNYRSLASVPFNLRGEILGILNIYSSEPDFFTEEEIKLVEEIGLDISMAIDSLETEKELLFKTTLLEAQLESTIDGILVVDTQGKSILSNQRFGEMWNIPNEILDSKDDNKVIGHVLDQLKDPKAFTQKVEYLYAHMAEKSRDEIEFKDGKTFDRYSSPLMDPYGNYGGRIWYFRNITELKQSEEALIESEKNYRELVNTSLVGVYKTSLKGDILFANDAMATIAGLGSVEELKSKNITEFYKSLADRENIIKILKKEGSIKQYEMEMVSAPGENITVMISAYISDNTISGVIIDTTEKNKAEKKLINSEKRFRELINSSTDLIRILDENGKIIFDSPSSERILGYPEGFFMGKSPLEFIHPADLKHVKNDLTEVYENRNPGIPTEFRIRKADGTYLPVESTSRNMINVPTINGIVITTHPIHKRKAMENVLRESEEKYRTLFESDPAYTILLSLDGVILDVNTAASHISGLSKDEFVGKHFTEIEIFPKEELSLHKEKFSHLLKQGNVAPYESRFIGKNGDIRWAETGLTLIKKDNSNPYIMIINSDITERKIAENEIKSALREKELLIKEIHHRVKNNMQIISSLLNLQKNYVEEEESLNILQESQNRVKSMAMIHEKLYRSKTLTHINFEDYIQNLISDLFYSYSIKKGRIDVITDIENTKLNLETAVPCGLIINEIVSNSLKYAFPNKKQGKIKISFKTHGQEYELIISDDGIGIPKEIDFKNTDSLGLQLVNSLIEQVDGEIKLDRTHGTKYKIKFKELEYEKRI